MGQHDSSNAPDSKKSRPNESDLLLTPKSLKTAAFSICRYRKSLDNSHFISEILTPDRARDKIDPKAFVLIINRLWGSGVGFLFKFGWCKNSEIRGLEDGGWRMGIESSGRNGYYSHVFI
eukprot:1104928-Amorphochlora_amoeboformis.AAC.2